MPLGWRLAFEVVLYVACVIRSDGVAQGVATMLARDRILRWRAYARACEGLS